MRDERDMLGTLTLPEACAWGIHTERARRTFDVSERRVSWGLIRALVDVKRACCRANGTLGEKSSATQYLYPADNMP